MNPNNRFETLEKEATVSNFSQIMKEATKFVGMTKKEPSVLSRGDQEMKQPEDSRKELRKKENR